MKHEIKLKHSATGLWYSRKLGGFSESDAEKASAVPTSAEAVIRYTFDALGENHSRVETVHLSLSTLPEKGAK